MRGRSIPDLVEGKDPFRLEARSLDHVRALGGNDAADEARFATAARVSEINLGLYQTLVAPIVRNAVTELAARQCAPHILTGCASLHSLIAIP